MDDYLDGIDQIVGASLPADPNGPFLVLHVKNVGALVAKQGGAMGALAQQLVPSTITNQVYSEMAKKIGAGMKAEGVDADISVMSNKPAVGGAPQDFTIGAVSGVLGAGVVYGLVRLVKHFIGGRK